MKYLAYHESPIGRILLIEHDGVLTHLCFENDKNPVLTEHIVCKKTALLTQAIEQLTRYFAGQQRDFTLPFCPSGTVFEKKIWQALLNIPYGETRSYLQIASQIGNPKAYRAVGAANHKNPIAIFIPCHRVIGKNGNLVGYAGGLDKKKWLLEHEHKNVHAVSCAEKNLTNTR